MNQNMRIQDKQFVQSIRKQYFDVIKKEMNYFEENNIKLKFIDS